MRKYFWVIIPRSRISRAKPIDNISFENTVVSMAMALRYSINSKEHDKETLAKAFEAMCKAKKKSSENLKIQTILYFFT